MNACWILAYEVDYIFEFIFWVVNYLVKRLSQLTDMVMGNVFRKYFLGFEELAPKPRPFLIYQPTAINQKQIMKKFFLTLLKVCTEAIKK